MVEKHFWEQLLLTKELDEVVLKELDEVVTL